MKTYWYVIVYVVSLLLAIPYSFAESRPRIAVELPSDRTKCGRLILYSSAGKIVAGPFLACGVADLKSAKKHSNETRSSILPYGDTPTGGYGVIGVFRVGDNTKYNAKSYGDYAAIRLQPTTGDARLASEAGRTGFLIHGGDMGAKYRLRPTNGCIRLSNPDMKKLVDEIIVLAATESPPNSCSVSIVPDVTVVEPASASGYDEGDPPPLPDAGFKLP
jgi:hypothetical protein